MNLRHAAALALVGWYLLTPWMTLDDGVWKVDTSVPLSQWDRGYVVYDSERDCEEQIAELKAMAKRQKNWTGPSESAAQERRAMMTNVRCIATDDPCLKEK